MNKLYYDRGKFKDCNIAEDIMLSEVLDYWLTNSLYLHDKSTVINHLCDTFDILPITAKYILKLTRGL